MTDRPQDSFFTFSERVTALPVVHGSADYALAVRDRLLRERFDCIAIPLPATLQADVEAAVDALPRVSCVLQVSEESGAAYVPIDPSQAVIHAIRLARQERIPVRFVDLELEDYRAQSSLFPDPYALKVLSPEQMAAAILAVTPRPEAESQTDRRVRRMAFELHKLELDFDRILFLPSVLDWIWVREAFLERRPYPEHHQRFAPVEVIPVAKETLAFFLAEIPWVTHLYEQQRRALGEDRSLGVDGIKELALEARDRLLKRRKSSRRRVSVKTLRIFLQYVRNLAVVRNRLRPDLFMLVEAAKQVLGDDYAIEFLKVAREYPDQPTSEDDDRTLRCAPDVLEHPERGTLSAENYLPGDQLTWEAIDLRPEPEERERTDWTRAWNPYEQCSWPPEDSRIENFNRHVREQAKNLISTDLAKTEKFQSSLKDGIDIRETLRNWHEGSIYVRELPPARGSIDTVVFLFDVPADPERYRWRTTWFAEHQEESTLVFFATDYMEGMIGPGIAEARYGGAFFLFPPRPIPDIWTDPRFADVTTLEERLLAGAFAHSKERHVAVVSPTPIKATWRRLARRFGKKPIHLPLGRFSTATVDRLRTFHVLNGRDVRSYASRFIRGTE